MLDLTGAVHVAADAEALFEDLGRTLLGAARQAVADRGVFHVALSGGGTPEPFYMRLVTDPLFRDLPWAKTHVWIVDERRVPEEDAKSNIRMIRESLLSHVPIRSRQIHPMPVLLEDPAAAYEAELAEAFGAALGGPVPVIDFILLGMGGDNHTASLFPQSPALTITDRWIATNDGPRVVPPPRVTMTYPLINHGRHVAVLLTGAGKFEALKKLEVQRATGAPDIAELPISGIDPEPHGGELVWYLDRAAATGQ